MSAGGEVDRLFGLTLHPDKLQSFANNPTEQDQLAESGVLLGPPTYFFKLLGLTYNLLLPGSCVPPDTLTAVLWERCRKIRLAGRGLALRRALLHLLVIPLLRGAAWQRFTKATMHSWTMAIESALWGKRPPPGRSRLLFWHVFAGAGLHPRFAHLQQLGTSGNASVGYKYRCFGQQSTLSAMERCSGSF